MQSTCKATVVAESVVPERAITYAYGEAEMVNSGWGRITWRAWCQLDLARLLRKGDREARIAEGHGYVWLTR